LIVEVPGNKLPKLKAGRLSAFFILLSLSKTNPHLAMQQNSMTFMIFPNLILARENKVLLLRRAKSMSLFPGYWHLPTGKIEEGETPLACITREAKEEIGLELSPSFASVVVYRAPSFHKPDMIWRDISMFFIAPNFTGEPINMEPNRHDMMEWFAVDNLPQPMIPNVEHGIKQYFAGKFYSELW
jgi:8-oxo-dGTP diphosphatase